MIENCPKRPFLTILESFGELVLKPVNITTIRKSNSLKSKYQEMRGGLQTFAQCSNVQFKLYCDQV